MTDEERQARLAELQAILATRKDVPGYRKNAAGIEAEVERLNADAAQDQAARADQNQTALQLLTKDGQQASLSPDSLTPEQWAELAVYAAEQAKSGETAMSRTDV